MDPLTIMAIVSIATAAYGAKKQNDQIKASNKSLTAGLENEVAGKNKQTQLGFNRANEGTVLGGSDGGAGTQGTVLTTDSQKKSILG